MPAPATRERVLLAHSINPPHLIPLVELVPSSWTDPAVIDQADALMTAVGQAPIRLTREIDGFVANRLQGAVPAEAFRLVEDGVCDGTDVDIAMAKGIGLRWAFLGPFATIDLNAPSGLKDCCDRLSPLYNQLAREQADPREWSARLVDRRLMELAVWKSKSTPAA